MVEGRVPIVPGWSSILGPRAVEDPAADVADGRVGEFTPLGVDQACAQHAAPGRAHRLVRSRCQFQGVFWSF